MKLGLVTFPTEYAMPVGELAREAEARGLESLWVPEHTHIPASRRTPFLDGRPLPREYWHALDPFVALATAAAATSRLRLGTGVCLVAQHDPITLAKTVASLDHLSDGRLLLGVGAGWNAEEMENHGTRFADRWRVLRERVLAMKAIWTREEAEFHGEFVDFGPLWSRPKPRQVPHPPVLLGANTPAGRQRVVEYGDGWLPFAARPADLAAGLADLHERAARAGRDPRALPVTVYSVRGEAAGLAAYARAGVERAVLAVPSAGREVVLPLLDAYAGLGRALA